MNTIIFQTIRAGIIVGVAFFALVSDALAAPMLTPVTATRITENSATIVGHVSNPQKNSTVWFELFNNTSAPTSVAVQGIWNEGTFEWNLRDLNPGQTYSYRSVAMEGGVTVYSGTSSFTTAVPKQTSTVITYQSIQKVAQVPVVKTKQEVTVKSATTTPVAIVTKEGFTNGNTAAVIGAGGDMFPTTLIGWILLIISVLIAVLIGDMIYKSTENRNKRSEDKKGEEEEGETE